VSLWLIFGVLLPILLLLQPYVLYPWSLGAFGRPRAQAPLRPRSDSEWPSVAVVLSARNEEAVLDQTLKSLLESDYPAEKLWIVLGSDASTDGTVPLAEQWANTTGRVEVLDSEQRLGKAEMLNRLATESQADWLLFTDANIRFDALCIRYMVGCALDREATAVGGRICDALDEPILGVARDESRYLAFENRLREAESRHWGAVIGVEGGCLLLKRSAFRPIPPGTAVDDFYQNLQVIEAGGRVLFEPRARVWERDAADESGEYRRKRRIGLGNRQNLLRFGSLLWKRPYPVGYALLSHKFLRWGTALWLFWLALGLLGWAWSGSDWASALFVFGLCLVGLSMGPLKKRVFFRSIRHFILMNLALTEGLILSYGSRPHHWEPTRREEPTQPH